MHNYRITGHTEDMDGWAGEPIVIIYSAPSSQDAVRRFKAEEAMIVTRVEYLGKSESEGGALRVA